jgi:uncharacterized membrane protein
MSAPDMPKAAHIPPAARLAAPAGSARRVSGWRELWRRLPLADLCYLALVGVTLGAMVHLAAVLAAPLLATRNADARLAALAQRHVVTVLPLVTPDDALPYRDPATPLAVCRFDLSDGPVRVRAATQGDVFLSLAFHRPGGGVFYALTDRGATRGQIEALIVTPAQLEALQAVDPEDEPVRELRLTAPQTTGFVTLRALAPEPGALPEAVAFLAAARCGPEPLPASPSAKGR